MDSRSPDLNFIVEALYFSYRTVQAYSSHCPRREGHLKRQQRRCMLQITALFAVWWLAMLLLPYNNIQATLYSINFIYYNISYTFQLLIVRSTFQALPPSFIMMKLMAYPCMIFCRLVCHLFNEKQFNPKYTKLRLEKKWQINGKSFFGFQFFWFVGKRLPLTMIIQRRLIRTQ